MLSQPAVFVSRAVLRIRSRNQQGKQQGQGAQGQGQQQGPPGPKCARYVGLQYLQAIRDSRVPLCVPASQQGDDGGHHRRSLRHAAAAAAVAAAAEHGGGGGGGGGGGSLGGFGGSGEQGWYDSLGEQALWEEGFGAAGWRRHHSHRLRHLAEAAGEEVDSELEAEAEGTTDDTGSSQRRLAKGGGGGGGDADADEEAGGGREPPLPDDQSSVDCYTAPFVPAGDSSKAKISLCRSRNLLLDSCELFAFRRLGTLSKKFPGPAAGAVRLGCELRNGSALAAEDPAGLGFLGSMNTDVWWANATRDDAAVAAACAPGSPTLVTTPTLFVLRDRHANYAHEMEVVSMAFSFLAALEPRDVAERGVQVVIADQAPPTGFLETWARMSRPHRLRVLAQDPFPPGTCFRSAFHIYTFAAGIGYNTNGDTVHCESPVVAGLSGWLRQMYGVGDPHAAPPAEAGAAAGAGSAAGAAAIAGPATAAAGVRGLRPPAGGIVLKNVVWLSRRNLEMVRLLLNASAGWKSMRMVRNEDDVVAGLVAAVQEWNAESCLLRRFDRVVKAEYERSFVRVHGVHAAMVEGATTFKEAEEAAAAAAAARGAAGGAAVAAGAGGTGGGGRRSRSSRSSRRRGLLRRLLAAVKREGQGEGDSEGEAEAQEEEDAWEDEDDHEDEGGAGGPAAQSSSGSSIKAGAAAAAAAGAHDIESSSSSLGSGSTTRASQGQGQQSKPRSRSDDSKGSSKRGQKSGGAGRLSAEDLAELERMIAEEEGADEEEDEEALDGIRQRDELLDFLAGVTADGASGSSSSSGSGSSSGSSSRRLLPAGGASTSASASGDVGAGGGARSRRRRLPGDVDKATGEGGGEEDEQEEDNDGEGGGGGGAAAASSAATTTTAAAPRAPRPPYMIGSSIVDLEKLWALDEQAGESCRRTNVLFKFVDGDFNELTYHQQLQVIFRTGVLAGVHGAGLTHGFFLAPGQSAVLQLLGDAFKEVSANNVFRNMAVSCGNHYQDVLYGGVDVDVPELKAAVKRAMDFVAGAVMEAQQRRSGPLRLVLDDQTHFNVVSPPRDTCPAAAQGNMGR
ncbi:hypothetical protein HXX76_013177 [Chlamydomonas incerta]|uniref:Uncharacterized protein n=1 Tax=Chlamydomonas incerta TaxID=51695 RepID=A0A835SIJ7_CHLIN|nr:hypothetical protein HXX76_013177 [Chlamydomonas incerta]|eukprot:KAG2426196.1 hypothetical protein HXX76_013177 [Chlamydomonas incerta]